MSAVPASGRHAIGTKPAPTRADAVRTLPEGGLAAPKGGAGPAAAEPAGAGRTGGASARHLYVHLPFCAHRCGYCDFVTVTRSAGAHGATTDHGAYVAALLTELGYTRIRLLTNNPQKINALRDHGIDVTGRLPLVTTSNTHNERYLRAKHERAGHLDLAEKSGG